MSDCKYFERGDDPSFELPICIAPIPNSATSNLLATDFIPLDCTDCLTYEKQKPMSDTEKEEMSKFMEELT